MQDHLCSVNSIEWLVIYFPAWLDTRTSFPVISAFLYYILVGFEML